MPGRTQLHVTAVPARHGPVGTEAITGPVTGFLLHTDDGAAPAVYVSGDTVDLDAMSALADLLHLDAAGFEELGDARLSLGLLVHLDRRHPTTELLSRLLGRN
ncbi:MBL fold metallo-hydrolase [Streptomyces bottropensis]|uniref:MBL fold metallo-hydrolase n=1 Tax=Streptomyces bottropensis TaxID=42235 RepID=UPI0036926B4A